MNVRQLSTQGIITAQESATVAEIARLMRNRHVGAVVVVGTRAGQTVALGIITDRDIVRAQLEHAVDLSALAAFEIMTGDPLILREDIEYDEAMDRMLARGVRRAPIVDAQGELVGLISVDDLIPQVARELGSLARLLEMQPTVEGLSGSPA